MPLSRSGDCHRMCGRCCTLTAFQANPHVIVQFPALKPDGKECLHLSWKHGFAECGIYDTRPDLCRIFPQAPVVIASIPECGYSFIELETA